MHLYYINLSNSLEADRRMRLQLDHMINVERYDKIVPVDGRDWNDIYRYATIRNAYFAKVLDMGHDIEFIQLQVGHLLSHLMAIKKAYVNGLDEIIIVEDDINMKILNFTFNKILALWRGRNRRVDIIQLYSSSDTVTDVYNKSLKMGTVAVAPRVSFVHGTCAYLISRSGMKKIMSFYNPKTEKFDMRRVPLDIYLAPAAFIYRVCNSRATTLPFVNIMDPYKLFPIRSMGQEAQWKRSYRYIDKASDNIIAVINRS